MTRAQIENMVVNVLDSEMDKIVHIDKLQKMVLCDRDIKISKLDHIRFRFNSDSEMMEIIPCRPRVIFKDNTTEVYMGKYDLPEHSNYEIRDDGVVYEYLTDENGEMIVDYVDFAYINIMIVNR